MLEGENDGYIFNDNFSLFLIYLLLVAIFVLFERIILCKALKTTLQKLIIQSNLCITTTLETGKKWSLFGGGRYSEGQSLILN